MITCLFLSPETAASFGGRGVPKCIGGSFQNGCSLLRPRTDCWSCDGRSSGRAPKSSGGGGLEELQTLRGLIEGHDDVFAAVEARFGELGGQVEALGQTLREREDQLVAANARFDQVRGHVDGLIERYRAALV